MTATSTFLVLYRHYDIAVLVIAEDFSSEFFQAAKGFGCWVAVGVIRSGLDRGDLGPKIIQEQRRRRSIRPMMIDLQNRQRTSVGTVRHVLLGLLFRVSGEQYPGFS